MVERKILHKKLDEILDGYGYEDLLPLNFGKISIEIQVEKGEAVLEVTERRTKKVAK